MDDLTIYIEELELRLEMAVLTSALAVEDSGGSCSGSCCIVGGNCGGPGDGGE